MPSTLQTPQDVSPEVTSRMFENVVLIFIQSLIKTQGVMKFTDMREDGAFRSLLPPRRILRMDAAKKFSQIWTIEFLTSSIEKNSLVQRIFRLRHNWSYGKIYGWEKIQWWRILRPVVLSLSTRQDDCDEPEHMSCWIATKLTFCFSQVDEKKVVCVCSNSRAADELMSSLRCAYTVHSDADVKRFQVCHCDAVLYLGLVCWPGFQSPPDPSPHHLNKL